MKETEVWFDDVKEVKRKDETHTRLPDSVRLSPVVKASGEF